MDNLKSFFKTPSFDVDTEKAFIEKINHRAKPILTFIYWSGGIIAFFYFLRSLLLDMSSLMLSARCLYFTFWGVLTYKTFFAKNTIAYDKSFVIYAFGGVFCSSLFYGVFEQNSQFLISCILLFLIGLLLCQLPAKTMREVAAIAVGMTATVLFIDNGFTPSELSDLLIITVWAVCCYVAAIIFENINRKLFIYERELTLSRDREIIANQEKSKFLALMSHEIRTPLTAIIGNAELALNTPYEQSKTTDALKSVYRNSHHLLTLINDVLDLSKIESEKLVLEIIPFELFLVVDDACSLVRGAADKKNLPLIVDYQWPLPAKVNIDPTRLKQVLINLLANAIKFTQIGSVTLKVSYQNNQLQFAISDTGIGLSEFQQEQLFNKFTQADSTTTRKFGGSGLGLYLSQNIANMMSGEITVSSEIGVGSCFILTILAEQHEHEWLAQLPEIKHDDLLFTIQSSLQGRILLVEDYKENREFIGEMLQLFGLQVDYSENGEQAVEKALAEDFDIILMDIQMPVLGGVEAMTLLKASGCGSTIIALTANVLAEEIQSYLQAGFDDCISKPIKTKVFFNILAQYLPIEDGVELSSDNQDKISALKNSYHQTLHKTISKLQQAQHINDWQALRTLSHQVKGAAGNFGLHDIGNFAAIVELAATEKNREKSDNTLDIMYEKIRQLDYEPS